MAATADGIAIVGPTASGKTALSIAVAEALNGEVVSMDSRQIYRGMDIGTAKPTSAQRAAVRHHGLDLRDPHERYNAGRFAEDARGWIDEIRSRGRVPVLVGGTGFFLKALTSPLFEEPSVDAARKEQLKHYLGAMTRPELHRWLSALDHVSAERMVTQGGRQRLARAIEVALLTGRPLSEWHRLQQPQAAFTFATFVLDLPREVLYERINARVDQMIAAGFAAEVAALLSAGYGAGAPGMSGTGYPEMMRYLGGENTLGAAADAIRAATRRYARRQVTWFRHQIGPDAIKLDATLPVADLVAEIAAHWRQRQGGGQ